MCHCKTNFSAALCAVAASLLLAGCGDGGGGEASRNVEADALQTTVAAGVISVFEDTTVSGALAPASGNLRKQKFSVVIGPTHGSLWVDPETGTFRYKPVPDYFGGDSFVYRSSKNSPQAIQVNIQVDNVNDAPVLAAIPDQTNSAETYATSVQFGLTDVDGDAHVDVAVGDSSVAVATVDETTGLVSIEPKERGTTSIRVRATDSEFSSERTFEFSVGDVTKERVIAADMVNGDSVTMLNTSTADIGIQLEHNGFPLFQSDEEIVRFVENMKPEVADEPFERKLWRFVRDSVYHNVPLTTDVQFTEPWALVGSLGWGFCNHVSGTYVRLARVAGYEAHVWGLYGHVVPEIKVADRWQVFDPDLAVFYLTRDFQVAGIADLQNDVSLVTAPTGVPVSGAGYDYPYSPVIAGYYASASNNSIADNYNIAPEQAQYQPLVLPPGSALTYPGRWTSTVMGVDGKVPYEVPYYLQAHLRIPAGWTGTVPAPWMVWEIRGSGRVRIFDTEYEIGSIELQELLQRSKRQITRVEVLSSTEDTRIVFFINAMRYALHASNIVRITGKDVWAIDLGTRTLPSTVRADATGYSRFRKPTY